MLTQVIEALLGCSHSNYCFPRSLTVPLNPLATVTGTYVVCLACGKELPYDWQNMRVIRSQSLNSSRPSLAPKRVA